MASGRPRDHLLNVYPRGQPPRFALLPSNLHPRCPAARSSFVKSCEWTRVSRASRRGVVSECEQDQEKPEHVRATCRRRHARARILATFGFSFSSPLLSFMSPLSPLPFVLSCSRSPVLSSFFFFIHVILHTRLPRFHRSTESTTGVLLLAANRHERSDRSDLFSFSIRYYATIENVRSVSRIRGKRCHVQHLPTSMMQLAFNPHSRTLKLNSTVRRIETGSY